MAEQNLNGADVDPGFEQMRGERVPQRVRMNRFPDACGLCRLPARQEDGLSGYRLTRLGTGE